MAGNKNSGGKTKYVKAIIKEVKRYLKSRQDEDVQVVVQESGGEDGQKVYKNSLKVKLPTIRGFAKYLGVDEKTMYNWAKKFPKFALALEDIKVEQKQRLMDRGLEGTYNSTIAKLILSANHGMKERSDLTSGDKPIPLFNYAKSSRNNNSDK